MAQHIDLGKKGEQLAEAFLVNRGHAIITRNWTWGKLEIDLITVKDGKLHFTEVKCRSSQRMMRPEESVNKKKLQYLFRAIDYYLYTHPQYDDFRFDILSVVVRDGYEPEYFYIEDVYH